MRVALPITDEAYEALKVSGFDVEHGCSRMPSGGWIIHTSEGPFENLQKRLRPNETVSDYILKVIRSIH